MNKYTKICKLGTNSDSEVYKVVEIDTKKEYAMKVVNTERMPVNQIQNQVKLFNELSKLSHPHVVKYITSFTNEMKTEYVLIMEYFSDKILTDIIKIHKSKKEMMTTEALLYYVAQLLSGLNFLHSNHLVHGGLNPDNILITNKGQLKITGYGTIRYLPSEMYYTTITPIRTSSYTSPEVLKGERCGFAADIWSLGCIFHELCCLDIPYNAAGASELIDLLDKKKYHLIEIPSKYSTVIKNMVTFMLDPDKNLRPNCNDLFRKFKICISDGYFTNLISRELKELNDAMHSCFNAHRFTKFDDIKIKLNEYIRQMMYIENRIGTFVNKCKLFCGTSKVNGRMIYPYDNGNNYNGEFKDGKRSGIGIYCYDNTDRYEGEWRNNKKNGIGVIQYATGNKYEGEWRNNARNGKGIYCFFNNNKFEGKFSNCKFNNKGIMYYRSGSRYEGKWKEGKRHGKGKLYYSNGDVYDGMWKNDEMHGKGIMYYENGDKYEGEWKNSMKNGIGVFFYHDFNVEYIGMWKDGTKNGKAIVYSIISKMKYIGRWKVDKLYGKGDFVLPNHSEHTASKI